MIIDNNKALIIITSVIVILTAIVIIVGKNVKIEAKNMKFDNNISQEIDEAVDGTYQETVNKEVVNNQVLNSHDEIHYSQ